MEADGGQVGSRSSDSPRKICRTVLPLMNACKGMCTCMFQICTISGSYRFHVPRTHMVSLLRLTMAIAMENIIHTAVCRAILAWNRWERCRRQIRIYDNVSSLPPVPSLVMLDLLVPRGIIFLLMCIPVQAVLLFGRGFNRVNRLIQYLFRLKFGDFIFKRLDHAPRSRRFMAARSDLRGTHWCTYSWRSATRLTSEPVAMGPLAIQSSKTDAEMKNKSNAHIHVTVTMQMKSDCQFLV
jgi:uncharacterized membrane protein YidH (DUF202 family)